MSGIVISYRRDDAEGSAGRLYDRLVSRYGQDYVFMDFYSIESGEDWLKAIETTVAASDAFLAVIGPRWSSVTDEGGRRRLDDEGDYVRHEIRIALEQGVRALPVLVQGARMVGPEALPADLAALPEAQAFTLDSRYYDRDVERLCRSIDGIVGFGGEIPRFEQQRTALAGFAGLAPTGPTDQAALITKWSQFERTFGGFHPRCRLAHSVQGWFANGGEECFVVRVGDQDGAVDPNDIIGTGSRGLAGLERAEGITLVAVPDIVGLYSRGVFGLEEVRSLQLALIAHCELAGNRLAILDPLPELTAQQACEWARAAGWDSRAAALYYPWIRVLDPAAERFASIPPSGHVAGTWARNDKERGVWVAPANLSLRGVVDVQQQVTNEESLALERAGINSIRSRGGRGIRVWGARTLSAQPSGTDIATVRLVGSLGAFMGEVTSWAAFESSNPRTWNRLRSGVEAVLESLWRKGAFVGEAADEAFYVTCDEELNVPELVAAGRIRVEFGFAAKAPGDFIRIAVEQPSGDVTVYAE